MAFPSLQKVLLDSAALEYLTFFVFEAVSSDVNSSSNLCFMLIVFFFFYFFSWGSRGGTNIDIGHAGSFLPFAYLYMVAVLKKTTT